MDENIKQVLLENASKRIASLFVGHDDPETKFAKSISDLSVKAAVIVLEEYEKLKNF